MDVTQHARDKPKTVQLQPILAGQTRHTCGLSYHWAGHGTLYYKQKSRQSYLRPNSCVESLWWHGRWTL